MTRYTIAFDANERMSIHAEEVYPFEACGFLIGSGTHITRISRSRNLTEDDRRDHFEIDPEAHLRLQRELREKNKGEQILGIYHSHPDHAAEPSAHDIERSPDAALLWVIMSVRAQTVRETRLYTNLAPGSEPVLLSLDTEN